MIHTIENDEIRVQISSLGAELQSLVLKQDGTEFLWQGDPKYWKSRASNLFPICGRLWEGKYTYAGKTYEMNLHGFARKSEMEPVRRTADALTFRLLPNEETLASYPFQFEYTITFSLSGTSVKTSIGVTNHGEEVMPFAVGGHPGFNVPLGGRGGFTDYELAFADPGHIHALALSSDCFATDDIVMLPLKDGKILPLRHEMFDNDAMFLAESGHSVTLRSPASGRQLRLDYPDMKYLGIWHAPKTDAPYVCLEPWTSVPAYHGKVDALETKRDMIRLAQGGHYEASYTITLL